MLRSSQTSSGPSGSLLALRERSLELLMITRSAATVVRRRRLSQGIVLGIGAGLGLGILGEALLTLFPNLLHQVIAPSADSALGGLPWAVGFAVVVGALFGVSAWLRQGRQSAPAAGGTLVIPGMIEVAINGAMTPDPSQNWAIFIDVSNIMLGENNTVDLTAGEMERALDWLERAHGRILVRQAYGDFSAAMQRSGEIGLELRRRGFTLLHMPRLQRGAEKNHSDIQLAVDAALIGRARPDIGGFILMGGDGDFTPLLLQLRSLGKRLFVVGREQTTSAALLSQADSFTFMETITGREKLAPSALHNAETTLRNALTALDGQGIAVPAFALPSLLKTLGIDVTGLGFNDTFFFQRVMIDLGILRKSTSAQGDLLVSGPTAPGDDTLEQLLRAMGASVTESGKRNRKPTLSQTLEPIWKTEPSLDVTKTTPLVMLHILNIAERLNIVGTERRAGEEVKLIPGKLLS